MLLLTVTCLMLGAAAALPRPAPTALPDKAQQDPGTYFISSPNYPSNYGNDYTKTWSIRGAAGQTITVQCNPFNIEEESSCGYDFLSINGVKHCGSKPVALVSSTVLAITFETDSSVTATGFYCTITVPESGSTTTTQAPSGAQCCGVANRATRIVGGVETEVNEFPWQAGIATTGNDQPFCGGTVINNQWVMTAAHCMPGQTTGNTQVLLRKHQTAADSNQLRMNVAQIVNHPSYNSGTQMSHDFALLKLTEPLNFSALDKKVAPACLPTGGDFVGVDAIVSGWGTTASGGSPPSSLLEVTVKTMSNTECLSDQGAGRIDASMICADVDAGGKDSCQGDSGGPLVTAVSGRYTLIGVVSWGQGCADKDSPGVYARMTSVAAWIASTTAGASLC